MQSCAARPHQACCEADMVTYASIISACQKSRQWERAMDIYHVSYVLCVNRGSFSLYFVHPAVFWDQIVQHTVDTEAHSRQHTHGVNNWTMATAAVCAAGNEGS